MIRGKEITATRPGRRRSVFPAWIKDCDTKYHAREHREFDIRILAAHQLKVRSPKAEIELDELDALAAELARTSNPESPHAGQEA